MSAQTPDTEKEARLLIINRILQKAIGAESETELAFIILNDTFQVFPYERAILWKMKNNKIDSLLGVSGQAEINDKADWVLSLKNKLNEKELQQPFFSEEEKASTNPTRHTIIWLPIVSRTDEVLGLYLETWKDDRSNEDIKKGLNMLTTQLLPAYGNSWAKFAKTFKIFEQFKQKKLLSLGLLAALAALFLVQVPLRIVAPCEVVPKNPVHVTTPLQGFIRKIFVRQGQFVHKGDVLFEYDEYAPLQELKIAEKEVEISRSEYKRATVKGFGDNQSTSEVEEQRLKLKKALLNLQFAKYQASLLKVEAPVEGSVQVNDPESWAGKPVKVGETILTIGNVSDTEVKIWIPATDNVHFDMSKPVEVVLSTSPLVTRYATIRSVSDKLELNERNILGFKVSADWDTPQDDVKFGLTGRAVLHGENVSLINYLFRKPIYSLRYYLNL